MQLANGLPIENITRTMMIYLKKTKAMTCSLDSDTVFFDIVAGVLQGHTLAPCILIINLDYVQQTSIDLMKEKDFM